MELLQNVQLISSIVFVVIYLSSIHPTNANELMWKRQADDTGTTENIASIFRGRCYEFLQCLQNDQCTERYVRILLLILLNIPMYQMVP